MPIDPYNQECKCPINEDEGAMKKMFFAVILALMVCLWSAGSALASDGMEDHCASGYAFGQHHAEMAQEGMLGAEMNPGNHQGYSVCLP
jgi:hypothetical protein